MKRYLKVRGLLNGLVANPHALDASPRRYAGQQRRANAAEIREESERYKPIEEVLLDDRALRKAARAGEIEILAEGTGVSAGTVTWIVAPVATSQADEPAGKDS